LSKGYLKSREGTAGKFSVRIDELFSRWDRDGSPGANLAVVHRGELIHQRGYGVANIEDDVPFTIDTVLRLGSTTKHLCATCVLVLENRGLLSLEDDIREYIPEMPDYGTVITLRHLLSMTSGLWDGLNILLFCGMDPGSPVSREQLLDLYYSQDRLMFSPGDDCTYANPNYTLISVLIERVADMTLAEFMQAELFEPLAMDRSCLAPQMKTVIPHKAKGYNPAADDQFEAGYMMVDVDGAGAVDSTVSDMLKWFANYRDDKVFGPDYRQRMEFENRLNDGSLLDYRLGIEVKDYRGMQVVRHSGGMPGYLCDFVFFPEPDLGIVLFTNLLEAKMLQLPNRIADIVLEEDFERPEETAFLDPEREDLAPLLGVYASEEEGLVVELAAVDGKLYAFYLGDMNLLIDQGGWLKSDKNLLAIRPGRAGLELRLGCQPAVLLQPVGDPRSDPLPLPSDINSFIGNYLNKEIKEIHEVSLVEGKLRVDLASPVRDLVWGELTRLSGDLFLALIDTEPSCTNVTVRFRRNACGDIEALSYSISRCRDVVFKKQQDIGIN
jgi:CubicO group peptidase (beta-lactamase class C family)